MKTKSTQSENEHFAIEQGDSYCTECDAVVFIDAALGEHCLKCPCRDADGSCNPSLLQTQRHESPNDRITWREKLEQEIA